MRKTQYKELAALVASRIEEGILTPGSRLPTHRAFAEEHGIALATATRTYKELERQGLIVGERGRGMFVRDPAQSVILGLQQTAPEGLIDLVCNIPREGSDPEILRRGLKTLANSGDHNALLRYQPSVGRVHEREIVAKYLDPKLDGFDRESVLITSGIQHGLTISLIGLLSRGDLIGTDEVTYPGFKSIASLLNHPLVPIGQDGYCMDPSALEETLKTKKLKALYLMPTVHNPLGAVMDLNRRQKIVDLAREHGLLILEDTAYSYLETTPPPPIFNLAPERTIYLGSFSKSFATGLRIGYLVCPSRYVERLGHVIRATTWNTPPIISALVTGWISDGTIERVESSRREDGASRQRMCCGMLEGFELIGHKNASVAWIPLPSGARAGPIITRLNKRGIAVSSGEPFAVTDETPQVLRIAFGGFPFAELKPIFQLIRQELLDAHSALRIKIQ